MTLQELRFKPVNVTILSLGADSRVLVKWDLQETAQNLQNLYFYIDRGESPQSLSQLNAEGIPATLPSRIIFWGFMSFSSPSDVGLGMVVVTFRCMGWPL